ncbi:hypothetical protein QAD02_017808 [Eretmocerus hayati]|uniref:Uncharacterized protein n=1 Tax=Eretmocerus hayati TaxID=131215 RepID=A0ACC2PGS0_9HYME|nr:hypothetical protein QAD02_017808 [Eretmocerus hayati]
MVNLVFIASFIIANRFIAKKLERECNSSKDEPTSKYLMEPVFEIAPYNYDVPEIPKTSNELAMLRSKKKFLESQTGPKKTKSQEKEIKTNQTYTKTRNFDITNSANHQDTSEKIQARPLSFKLQKQKQSDKKQKQQALVSKTPTFNWSKRISYNVGRVQEKDIYVAHAVECGTKVMASFVVFDPLWCNSKKQNLKKREAHSLLCRAIRFIMQLRIPNVYVASGQSREALQRLTLSHSDFLVVVPKAGTFG